MPPKVKFTKEQIVATALEIAKKEGISGIAIRKVAETLGCSIAPIYVNFETVDDLKEEVVQAIVSLGNQMVAEVNSGHPFRDIGIASVRFASDYPTLFFEMTQHQHTYGEAYAKKADQGLVALMRQDPDLQGIVDTDLHRLLLELRAFQTGLGMMIANETLPKALGEKEQLAMLEEVAEALIAKMKRKEHA